MDRHDFATFPLTVLMSENPGDLRHMSWKRVLPRRSLKRFSFSFKRGTFVRLAPSFPQRRFQLQIFFRHLQFKAFVFLQGQPDLYCFTRYFLLPVFVSTLFSFCTMVVIQECDERGREIYLADPLERAQLRRDCLRHATRQNSFIDWEAYDSSYFGHMTFSDLSSESSSDNSDDSICIFLYTTSGKEIVARVSPQMMRGRGTALSEVESDTKTFGDDVQSYTSVYCDQARVNLFRSKNAVSATRHEEDIDMRPCSPGEIVCVTPRFPNVKFL